MTKLLIIYTGGTIGMIHKRDSGVLIPFDFEQIRQNMPELNRLGYFLEVHSFEPVLDSSNMDTGYWKKIAALIGENYNDYNGFVILHGTDTMAFTASVLSFMLGNLAKSVILTGSQLPIGQVRSDAKENLLTALEIAASECGGKPMFPEVCIYFGAQLFRGNRSVLYNCEKFEAFRSPNYPVLAESGVKLQFYKEFVMEAGQGGLFLHTDMNPNIGVLTLYPGITTHAVRSVTDAKVDAIVLETFGCGNTITANWFMKSLRSAIKAGKIIVNISQCIKGSVQMGRYQTSNELLEIGVLSGYDLTFEAAISKLMFLLSFNLSNEECSMLMQQSLRGELTNNMATSNH